CAVVFFQIPDLAARCRVRDEDRLRGKMDRPVFGDGEQGLETAEIGHRGRPSAGCDSRVRWWCNNRTTSVWEMHPGVDGSGCLCHSTSARLAVMSEGKTGREVAADSTGTRADLARSAGEFVRSAAFIDRLSRRVARRTESQAPGGRT